MIAYMSQYMLDYYHCHSYVSEFWQPARFHFQSGIDYDIHDPYTDAFNKALVSNYVGKSVGFPTGAVQASTPSGKDDFVVI